MTVKLIKLKTERKDELKWLLPVIGDWHILKNYQLMLMKIYHAPGLKDMIELFTGVF